MSPTNYTTEDNVMASIQPCDHTSVGILVFRDGKLLIIDRKRPPKGLAAPAGHVDKHGRSEISTAGKYQAAAFSELKEETGIIASSSLELLYDGIKNNPCRRPDGTWHHWKIYKVEATGELKPSAAETRAAFWCTREQMMDLLSDIPVLLEGGRQAGLEPVWKEFFGELNILKMF